MEDSVVDMAQAQVGRAREVGHLAAEPHDDLTVCLQQLGSEGGGHIGKQVM